MGIKRFSLTKSMVCILIIFSILATDLVAVFPLNCYAKNDNDFDIAIYYENGHSLKYSDVSDELLTQFLTEYENISASEQKWIKSTNASNEYSVGFYSESSYYHLSKYVGGYESYIEIGGNYYNTSDRLDSLIETLINSDATLYMEPDEHLLTYTTGCTEPKTDEEYIAAAQDITAQWLDYLKTTDSEYSIKTYSFDKNFAANGSRLLADGYVNGLREWTVEVRFDVDGIPDDSVFYDETGYNTYYSYYFGPMVILRLCWQDGICSVVDYDGAYMGAMYGGSLLDNLYGVRTSENSYATFYEFMNDTENVNSYLTNGVYSPLVSSIVSHNVLMLSNGSIYYVDIGGSSSYDPLDYSDGIYTGKFARQFYDENGDSTYGSPVTYDDTTQSPTTIKFHEDFSLIFDDYNYDGNPDYTIKIDEDNNGSTYYVSCMSNDGTPRANPYNNEVYLAGCFDDSIRLQRNEDGYVRWYYNNDNELTSNTTLDDYRMYSQRYYEPDGLNTYADDTEDIICYLWNNTDKDVQLASSYSIEKYTDGEWVSVIDGLDISDTDIINDTCLVNAINSNTDIPAYSHIAVSFDVSAVTDTNRNEYRIALELGNGQVVYGGFYMGSSTNSDSDVSSNNDSDYGDNPDSSVIWYHFEDNPPIDNDKSSEATLTLENKISTKETASDVSLRSLYVLNDGNWEPVYCDMEFTDDTDYYKDIPYGEAVSVRISSGNTSYSATPYHLHRYVFFGNMIEALCQIVSGFSGDKNAKSLSAGLYTLYFTLELIYRQSLSSTASTSLPKDGDMYRLELGVDDYSEFVYFTY